MIYLRVKFYKAKRRLEANPDGTNDYTLDCAELWFHHKSQMALFESNEIEDALNTPFAQI